MSYISQNILAFFIATICAYVFGYINPEVTQLALVGLGVFIFFTIRFFMRLGNDLPLKELIIMIATLQWVVAPILSYHFYTQSQFYYMSIDEDMYMAYNVPAIIAFSAGLFITFFPRKYILNFGLGKLDEVEQIKYKKKGLFLFIVGLLTTFLVRFPIPPSLRFFLFLLTFLSYIGAFYLYRSNISYKWLWLLLAFSPTLFNATASSVFHEMFLWGGFIIVMYTFINKSSLITKLGLISMSVFIVILISSVKKEFRAQRSGNENVRGTAATQEFFSLINEQVVENKTTNNEEFAQDFVDRINQGWIIARVMYVVPEYEPFADGETIEDGLWAAIVPRVFVPDKMRAGGQTNFERFTGLTLTGTSMNLGIVGEAYGNYGSTGGIIFMFIYGFLFNIILHILRTKGIKTEEYLLWIPFLFLYSVKAEDDFGTSLNYLTKSAIVMIGFIWLTNKILVNSKKSV